ncbi:uncharacterized protein LOC113871756 [Abrus precatorius]|uniref:Uncharacterized protein LOC113871756 n=1 Tax=Abrus precatorius TaxID=3816 RepID=A0A8B8MC22_ABRPR|nr:uncharacterized protein LOC113871756 [Abrus precatorius]
MASLKADKPNGTQLFGQAKKKLFLKLVMVHPKVQLPNQLQRKLHRSPRNLRKRERQANNLQSTRHSSLICWRKVWFDSIKSHTNVGYNNTCTLFSFVAKVSWPPSIDQLALRVII